MAFKINPRAFQQAIGALARKRIVNTGGAGFMTPAKWHIGAPKAIASAPVMAGFAHSSAPAAIGALPRAVARRVPMAGFTGSRMPSPVNALGSGPRTVRGGGFGVPSIRNPRVMTSGMKPAAPMAGFAKTGTPGIKAPKPIAPTGAGPMTISGRGPSIPNGPGLAAGKAPKAGFARPNGTRSAYSRGQVPGGRVRLSKPPKPPGIVSRAISRTGSASKAVGRRLGTAATATVKGVRGAVRGATSPVRNALHRRAIQSQIRANVAARVPVAARPPAPPAPPPVRAQQGLWQSLSPTHKKYAKYGAAGVGGYLGYRMLTRRNRDQNYY